MKLGEEYLRKAIEKAHANGWKPGTKKLPFRYDIDLTGEIYNCPKIQLWDEWVDLEHVLYDLKFAQALWGDNMLEFHEMSGWVLPYKELKIDYRMTAWYYHLQQMVVSENPLEYLLYNV